MDLIHAVTVMLALLALAALPWLIALLILAGEPFGERTGRTIARLRSRPAIPPVEASAASLRRLSDELLDTPNAEAYRRAELMDAYDRALRHACVALSVPHRLNGVTGLDLDLERLRLVEELTAHGLVVRSPRGHRHHRGCQ